jgi:bifunctional non-homologous end joining protein LigD
VTGAVPAIAPMKAISAGVPTDDGWAFEVKWDGMRVVAAVGDEVRLTSAAGHDATDRFPELADLAPHLGASGVVLDGEVVALDGRGRADFGRLQPRMQARSPERVAHLRRSVPVTFVVFDLLHLDGHDTTALTYLERRGLLTDLVTPTERWLVPAHQVGDGPALHAAAADQGLEGIMAKRIDSPYLPGRRSPTWRKCKVRRRQEVVVGGWTPGQGGRGGGGGGGGGGGM